MSTAVQTSLPAITTAGKERFYSPELDALRFFAFFGVFMFHYAPRTMGFYAAAGFPEWLGKILIAVFGAGAYGVDLFFVLSAYLITSLLLREKAATGAVDVRSFYLRRILRIWPLYLSFVAFAAVAARAIPGQSLPAQYVYGYGLLAGNWVYVFYGLPASFAIPLWTISIEEQFYLVWPLALRRASNCAALLIAIGILLAANLCRFRLAMAAAPIQAMEYNTLTRLDPIALGILVALAGNRLPEFSSWQRAALLWSGVATWIATYAFSVSSNPVSVSTGKLALGHSLTAFASAAILLSVLGSSYSRLKNRALLYLGRISYGLYILHEFAHLCASRLLPAATPLKMAAQALLGLALAILLAAASYRWLETPFLKLKERFAYVQTRPA
jgi:peptidoglycan/LPS O-acetylase OafA/YrhL